MSYNANNGTISNKPYSVAQAIPDGGRTYFYDAINFIWRPYQSTAEVLSTLDTQGKRTGHFPIWVNEGGTLNAGIGGLAAFTGGIYREYVFVNSNDDGLIPKSKLNNIFGANNVKDFGAKGDGTTDDTPAFQAAFNTSKTVFVPKGIYLVNGVILPIGAAITGVGEESIIKCVSGTSFTSSVTDDDTIIIRDINFNLTNSIGLKIERVNPAFCELKLLNCKFYADNTGASFGVSAIGLKAAVIDGNTFHGVIGYISTFTALYFPTDSGHQNININITNNNFYDIKDAIYGFNSVDDAFFLNAGYRIINNMFIGIVRYGCYLKNADYAQLELNMMDYVTIPVYFDSVFNTKIRHNYFASRENNHTIEIKTNTATTIAQNIEYTEIIGNRIFNYAKAQGLGNGGDGIKVTATGKHMDFTTISDNTIDNVITAINVNMDSTLKTITRGKIQGNVIRSTTNGITFGVQTASNIVIGNTINDVTGITLNGEIDNIIGQNTINGNPTSKIYQRAGKIGINKIDPVYMLEVGGGETVGVTGGGYIITESPDGNTKSELFSTNGSVIFGSSTNHRVYIRSNDTNRISIDETGLVQIFNLLGVGDRLVFTDTNGVISAKNKLSLVTDVTTPDATDLASAIVLANSNKAKMNELLGSLKTLLMKTT